MCTCAYPLAAFLQFTAGKRRRPSLTLLCGDDEQRRLLPFGHRVAFVSGKCLPLAPSPPSSAVFRLQLPRSDTKSLKLCASHYPWQWQAIHPPSASVSDCVL